MIFQDASTDRPARVAGAAAETILVGKDFAPFAVTIFAGAFLLFLVQPLISKFILPWFGGGPGVWTTCLLFFQIVLLAGYAYAHVSTRLFSPRTQAALHAVLLVGALLLLPITPSVQWKPLSNEEPTLKILALLGICLGLPYFVLAATGPLIHGVDGPIASWLFAVSVVCALESGFVAGAVDLSVWPGTQLEPPTAGGALVVAPGGIRLHLRRVRVQALEAKSSRVFAGKR
jgi:hypothetical protein